MNLRGMIFDFDGTLFDSMQIWETAGADYLASLGLTAEPELGKKLQTMSLMESAAYLQAAYALPLTAEEIIAGINRTVEDFYLYRAKPKADVIPVLTGLRAEGVRLCIATANDRRQVEAALRRCAMLDYFDAVFTCRELGCGKDSPCIFESARSYLKTAKTETAVLEDAYHAAKTAKDAGFFVIGVYDPSEPRAEELRALADLYVSSFSELHRLLPTER